MIDKLTAIKAALDIAELAPEPEGFRRRVKEYAARHKVEVPVAKGGTDEQPSTTLVHKGFNPVGKTWLVEKSWTQADGTLAIEGWVSTPDRDIERDIVEPEAFYGETFEDYFSRSAPLSSNHDTEGYPIGHLQKGVLVRNGVIFQEEYHPTDPAEFTGFDPAGKGTGWYGRGVITDGVVASHVKKGNMGAFSWIGNLKSYEPLPGGGKRYHYISPLIESTVAAYPVNPKAVMQIAKAFGLKEQNMPEQNAIRDNLDLEKLLEGAAKKAADEAAAQVAKATVDPDQLGGLLLKFEERIMGKLEDAVKKAVPATPPELPEGTKEIEGEGEQVNKGVGRKSTIPAPNARMDNPVKYIVAKGRAAAAAKPSTNYNIVPDADYDLQDKDFMWAMTKKALITGMSNQPAEGEDFGDEYN